MGEFPGPDTTGSGVKGRLVKNNEFIRNGGNKHFCLRYYLYGRGQLLEYARFTMWHSGQ